MNFRFRLTLIVVVAHRSERTVAVTRAVPSTSPAVKTTGARPLTVVVMTGMMVPKTAVNVTGVPSATPLLYRSVTLAITLVLDRGMTMDGAAHTVIVNGDSGVKVTTVLAQADPLVAVMTERPALIGEVSVAATWPPNVPVLLGAIVAVIGAMVNATSVASATELLLQSRTVEVSVVVTPPTGKVSD